MQKGLPQDLAVQDSSLLSTQLVWIAVLNDIDAPLQEFGMVSFKLLEQLVLLPGLEQLSNVIRKAGRRLCRCFFGFYSGLAKISHVLIPGRTQLEITTSDIEAKFGMSAISLKVECHISGLDFNKTVR